MKLRFYRAGLITLFTSKGNGVHFFVRPKFQAWGSYYDPDDMIEGFGIGPLFLYAKGGP